MRTPRPTRSKARELGAQGIGLCRTEHMFFGEERLPVVQEMILADDEAARRAALDRLLPFQQSDFEGIFEAMAGLPVTIRLLDPPLHEFLPSLEEATDERLRNRILALHEANPMLGTRGCRLGLQWPEIYEMQVRAIVRAALAVRERTGETPQVEIMHPLVAFAEELRRLRELTVRVAAEEGCDLPYLVGTMIELPRACMRADEIAAHADFFSFGTNDLTQTALGFSRDDAEGKFLTHYLEDGVLAHDPFATLDQEGVGELMRIAVERGRAANAGADDRDLRRARRRPGVGAVLPRARARLRLLLALPRSRRPAGGGAGGARRERRGPLRRGRRLAVLASALAILLAAATTSQAKLPLRACVVQGVPAKCGTLLVPENRDTGLGPRIGLRIVVVPARRKPARPDAFAYLAGGPGVAAIRADRRGQQHLERRARAPRHPPRRPARHRRLAPAGLPAAGGERGRQRHDQSLSRVAERRPDAVRDRGRRGRPRGRPRRARLPHTEPLRDLVRRDARAGLPGAAPALGAVGGPRRGDADRRPLLRQVRRQRAARARPRRAALRARAGLRALVPGLAAAAPLADRGVEREAGRGRARASRSPGTTSPALIQLHDAERSRRRPRSRSPSAARPAATTRRWRGRSRAAAPTTR